MNKIYSCTFLVFLLLTSSTYAQDTTKIKKLTFQGQLSAWGLYSPANELNVWTGGRYLPQLNFKQPLKKKRLFDVEVSANIYGAAGYHLFDTASTSGSIKPYRGWVRYSTKQFEVRAGLQKINFGSATIIRPLRWFDQIDPRDPLQITDGVYGVLGRYYFLNNANVWLWGLYGNEDSKGSEAIPTQKKFPEFGGRIQLPMKTGEVGASYHYRKTNPSMLDSIFIGEDDIPENRIGLDGKWDWVVGLWLEGSWIHKNKDLGFLTNQTQITAGTDYTFGIGSGLNVIFEQSLFAFDKKAFAFENPTHFSTLAVAYPVGMFDNVNAIVYYDWTNQGLYSFVNWTRQMNNFTLNFMGFWNPKQGRSPQQGQNENLNLFAGKGIQIMIVFNH